MERERETRRGEERPKASQAEPAQGSPSPSRSLPGTMLVLLVPNPNVAAARKEQGPETEAAQASIMGQGSPSVATESKARERVWSKELIGIANQKSGIFTSINGCGVNGCYPSVYLHRFIFIDLS